MLCQIDMERRICVFPTVVPVYTNVIIPPLCRWRRRRVLYIVFLVAFLLLFGGVSTSTLVLKLLRSLLGVE